MSDLIESLRAKKSDLLAKLDALDAIEVTQNRALADLEVSEYEALDADFKAVSKRLASLEQRSLDAAVGAALSAKVDASRTTAYAGGNDAPYMDSKFNLVQDLYRAAVGDHDAQGRISASNRFEMQNRAATTASIPGTIIPSYERPVEVNAIEGRPFLNTLNRKAVTGEVVHIPTVTSEVDFDFQAGQNVAFANADIGTTDATYSAVTLGGYTDISVQALEWGSITTSEIVSRLQRVYNQLVDATALTGTTTTNSLMGIKNTVGVPTINGSGVNTFAEFWDAINEAAADIEDATLSTATHVVMSRRTWNNIKSLTAADGRPFLQTNYGQAVNVFGKDTYEVNGLTVVVDNNINNDQTATPTSSIIVYSPENVHFYEANGGAIQTITVDQVGAHTGTVRVVGRNYVNFPGVRPNPAAVSVITGIPFAW